MRGRWAKQKKSDTEKTRAMLEPCYPRKTAKT